MPKIKVRTDDGLTARTNAVPDEQWFWNVLVAPADGVSSVLVNIDVEITYYIKFWDKIFSSSTFQMDPPEEDEVLDGVTDFVITGQHTDP